MTKVSTRFEVFKRDGFTCQYCGRKTPEVVLEVDHILPRVEGGGDEIENLVTACWDCNRGKGRKLLDERAPVPDMEERTRLLAEREEQLRAYHEVSEEAQHSENAKINELLEYWEWLDENNSPRQYPGISFMRMWLKTFSVAEIKEAMEIAMTRAGDYYGPKYTGGILRNWKRDRESGE